MSVPGYSNELYEAIAGFGVHRGASVLDVTVDGDEAGKPFADNGFAVTPFRAGDTPDALPFPDERFDLVLCAQSIHRLPRPQTLDEMTRVLKKGGIIAVWWKQIMSQEGLRALRVQAYSDAQIAPRAEGLTGGFQEFYASPALRDQVVRVLPWRVMVSANDFVEGEDPRVQDRLLRLIAPKAGGENGSLEIAYAQYLYLAKKL